MKRCNPAAREKLWPSSDYLETTHSFTANLGNTRYQRITAIG